MTEALRLALFDLDHTLVPFDSGTVWMRFLVERGELEPGTDERYLEHCRAYVAGRLDALGLHRFAMGVLAGRRVDAVAELQAAFARHIAGMVPRAARELVGGHRDSGEVCCIVTTTSAVVAAPFAEALGVGHLLASEPEVRDLHFTGAIAGRLCHGAGKVERVTAWLAARSLSWDDVARSTFYSDAASDLPLLERVSDAVAVAPDAALRSEALARRWRIIERIGC